MKTPQKGRVSNVIGAGQTQRSTLRRYPFEGAWNRFLFVGVARTRPYLDAPPVRNVASVLFKALAVLPDW